MRVTTAAVAMLSILPGCEPSPQPKQETVPPQTLVFAYTLRNQSGAQTRYQIDGKEVLVSEDAREIRFVRALPGSVSAVQARRDVERGLAQPGMPGTPRLTAQALSPCGWRSVPIELSKPRWPANPKQIDVEAFIAGVPGFQVVIDNRRGPPRTLAVGQWKHSVTADTAEIATVPLGDCDPAAIGSIALDGEAAGPAPEPPRAVLLDPTGARCYRYQQISYVKAGLEGLPAGSAHDLRRKKWHPLPSGLREVDYLFEKAPPSLQSVMNFEQRSELTERACGARE